MQLLLSHNPHVIPQDTLSANNLKSIFSLGVQKILCLQINYFAPDAQQKL